MTTPPTVPWALPLLGTSDTIPGIDVLYNAQSNALNTALTTINNGAYARYTLKSSLPTSGVGIGQHATVTGDTVANNGDYIWDSVGATWLHLFTKGAAAYAEAVGSGSNTAGATTAVTFPTGRFTVAPAVFITMTGSVAAMPIPGSITTTGCNIGGFNAAGTAVASSWVWHAVQMTVSSATG